MFCSLKIDFFYSNNSIIFFIGLHEALALQIITFFFLWGGGGTFAFLDLDSVIEKLVSVKCLPTMAPLLAE